MNALCEKYGKKFTLDIKLKQMGRKEHESAQILINELNLPLTVEEYISFVHTMSDNLFPHAKLLPGVEKLVHHLHQHNVPIALATGGDSIGYKKKIANHQELFGLFHHIVFSTEDPEVKHGKPSPDCFLVCAERFKDQPRPGQILVFEDAPNGVQAASSAGMQVVWVPDQAVDRGTAQHLATLTLNSLKDFDPKDFGLPPY